MLQLPSPSIICATDWETPGAREKPEPPLVPFSASQHGFTLTSAVHHDGEALNVQHDEKRSDRQTTVHVESDDGVKGARGDVHSQNGTRCTKPVMYVLSGGGGSRRARFLTALWFLTVGLSLGTMILELLGPVERLPVQIISILTATASVLTSALVVAFGMVYKIPASSQIHEKTAIDHGGPSSHTLVDHSNHTLVHARKVSQGGDVSRGGFGPSTVDAVQGNGMPGMGRVRSSASRVSRRDRDMIRVVSNSTQMSDVDYDEYNQLLAQQRTLLEAVSLELADAQRALAAGDEARAEQQDLLRGFRKIITREAPAGTNVDSARKVIFVFEENPEARAELADLCSLLEYDCRAYASLESGLDDFRKLVLPEPPRISHVSCSSTESVNAKSRWKAVTAATRPGSRFGSAVLAAVRAAKERENLVRVVLLGFSILTKLPPDWDAENAFVALLTHPSEFEEVGRFLVAYDEMEIRSILRDKWSIWEYLLLPLSLDALRGLVGAAVRKHFDEEFLLLEQIGRGSFGLVHRAKRVRDLKVFALKEISGRRMPDKKLSVVDTERELLKELRWPTVLYLVDAWTNEKQMIHYLLMPLLEGGNVEEYTQRNTRCGDGIYFEQILAWFSQCVHGLTYLHWRGVLHRDVKPANLVLAKDGRRLRIGDFGSAMRLPGPGPHPASENKVKGRITTPDFASPESRESGFYYAASDIFSLGKTFDSILAQTSMTAESEIRTVSDVFIATPATPSTNFADLSGREEFAEDLEEMTSPEPQKRPNAATIMSRPAFLQPARAVLRIDFSEPELWEAHFRELARMLKESESASVTEQVRL